MIFRSKVVVDGLEYVVVPTKQGDTYWKKVLTRGLGGKKWLLLAVGSTEITNKHYKDPDEMRHWISHYENDSYEVWVKGNSLNIRNKQKIKSHCGGCHGCVILDAVHTGKNGKKEPSCPISVGT